MPLYVLARRTVMLGLLLMIPRAGAAREKPTPAVRVWLSDLVTRIDDADRAQRGAGPGRGAGTVVVHLEIAPDGALQRAEIERSSGIPGLDQRALRAVQAAGPLTAPPAGLVGRSGLVDLSIPVELGR